MTQVKRRKSWRVNCDVGEVMERLENEQSSIHSPTLPSLYLHHSSFSNSSVASRTSQLILQPFFCFSYLTGSSLTSPGEPPMIIINVLKLLQQKLNVNVKLSDVVLYLPQSNLWKQHTVRLSDLLHFLH